MTPAEIMNQAVQMLALLRGTQHEVRARLYLAAQIVITDHAHRTRRVR